MALQYTFQFHWRIHGQQFPLPSCTVYLLFNTVLSPHVPYSLKAGHWYMYQLSEKVLKNNACGTFARAT